jgi:hypothetical protein
VSEASGVAEPGVAEKSGVAEPGTAERDALSRANRRLTAAEQQIRRLERERDEWRARHEKAVAELAALRDVHRAHRIAQVLLLAVREPRVGWPRIGAAVRRRLPIRSRARGRTATGTPAGTAARPAARANWSTCLYIAIGLDLDHLRALTRTVAEAALVAGDHVPVVVTDCVRFSLLRDAGVVFEYIPSRDTWQAARPDVPWETMRARRLSHLARLHAPLRTVVVSNAGVPHLADLLAVHTGVPGR